MNSKTSQNIVFAKETHLLDLLKRPEISYQQLHIAAQLPNITDAYGQQIEIETKYAGYISRQKDDIARLKRNENTFIPTNLDYQQIKGLSNEARDKLAQVKPISLGMASRIQGVTPAAISLLLIHLKKYQLAQSVPLET